MDVLEIKDPRDRAGILLASAIVAGDDAVKVETKFAGGQWLVWGAWDAPRTQRTAHTPLLTPPTLLPTPLLPSQVRTCAGGNGCTTH